MNEKLQKQRRQRYFELNSQIAQIDNRHLASLLDHSEPLSEWGRNQTLQIGDTAVFIKRIPVTDLEHENMFSTKNLYALPIYYNYGIGSVGFNVFRELLGHIKTTNWVLNGETESFPLLYHYRIIPFSGVRAEFDAVEHKKDIAYWGGNKNIGQYRLDRVNANHELVLFLEHIPHVLHQWLLENPELVGKTLDDVRTTIDFIGQKGLLHLDAHFRNILTDGEQVYLTDFGLAVDRDFSLEEDEIAFFNRHTHYDYGASLSCLSDLVFNMFDALPASVQEQLREQYGPVRAKQQSEHLDDYPHGRLMFTLFENIEDLNARGIFRVNKALLTHMSKYRSICRAMDDFYSELVPNQQKDTLFPDAKLRGLLEETGFL